MPTASDWRGRRTFVAAVIQIAASIALLAGGPAAAASGPYKWQQPGRCGANALYVLAKLQGAAVTYDSVVAHLPPARPQGHSAAELQDAAARLGFPVAVRHIEPHEIGTLPLPFIMHLNAVDTGGEGHFITVFQLERDKGGIHYIDGSSGLQSMSASAAYAPSFSGYVIVPTHAAAVWSPWRWFAAALAACILAQVVFVWIVRMRK